MIVIGTSLGGLNALRAILKRLPERFPVPVVAVLHRHKESDDALVELLQAKSPLPVSEVLDKEPICPGHVYIAPADYHLFVEAGTFSLSTDDLVNYARPSIDVVFESAADSFGTRVIGVVLTGANQDGSVGAFKIKHRGGIVIVEDPQTAECPIMPNGVLHSIKPDYIRPVEEIGPLLIELTLNQASLR
jgi:two-component system chemotaxis response regulator CheB